MQPKEVKMKNEISTYSGQALARPVALVLHCGDPRFQQAINQFLEGELNLNKGEYVPLVPPGGAASLSAPDHFPEEFDYLKGVAGFYLNHFPSIGRVVIINHEDCGKYKAMHQHVGDSFLESFANMADRQCRDLATVFQTILETVERELEAHCFFARFTDSERTQIIFEAN